MVILAVDRFPPIGLSFLLISLPPSPSPIYTKYHILVSPGPLFNSNINRPALLRVYLSPALPGTVLYPMLSPAALVRRRKIMAHLLRINGSEVAIVE